MSVPPVDAAPTAARLPFQQLQREFAAHLRAPGSEAPPAGIEARRLALYRELVYNNLESFICSGFPVLRSLYRDADWHALVQDFVARHACRSPYFLQISEEFLDYLQREHRPRACDPPFLLELAHYEWVELALEVGAAEIPANLASRGDPLAKIPVLSPLMRSLSYRYPVHRIGVDFRPRQAPAAPTFLLVYRDRSDAVGFMEVNAVTARLLELAHNGDSSGRELLEALARELQWPDPQQLLSFGAGLLCELLEAGVIAGLRD
ncbi:putative DNA-binding domain-containing protein [Microbulbifer sp. SAOS-129_SWC]|uniref:HvfC family RiPP maturation protein n=1 Tax=Microbulbifer sp. SAOS-129_SWC TaxID=3145235 RepID=UPI003216A055